MTARVLLFDLETCPILGYAWQKYDTNLISIEQPFSILSFAYKWLEDDIVSVKALPDYKSYKPGRLDDSALMKDLWKLLDDADIVVAQNGDAFDVKKANARFLVNGMSPPSPYKTVDTLKVARKYFKLDSNRLDDLAKFLGLGGKTPHAGMALWFGCMEGDPAAWKMMKEYNAQDVILLEKVYLRLRPWFNHPDVSLYDDLATTERHSTCPNCGSNHVHRRGTYVAKTRKYVRLNCQGCGAWFTGPLEKKTT